MAEKQARTVRVKMQLTGDERSVSPREAEVLTASGRATIMRQTAKPETTTKPGPAPEKASK